ncbi:6725_t:CDS:2 [Racocetra persica]|uniref:6725_t:CDS:1 n=1 Tax=Racocetra persica TaxID=160502 RepID=A0ACA9PFY8_9GLOM|nr:6725_t:CDS:2 [Racocetra persica]
MANISRKTILTHFMFTIYTDNLQKYKELINENVNRKIIRYIVFQYKYTKTNKKHIQGFCMLWTQLRLGNYKYSKNASTIKSIFQDEEMHVDYHNGIFEDMIRYCKKDYNRCSKHHPYYKYDFFNLTKICNKCDKNCLKFHTFACVDDNSGPFEYGELPTNNNAEDVFVNSGTAPHIIKELYNTIRDSQKKSFKRYFTPCNIYIYSDSRTGKDYLIQILFSDAYHKSHDNKQWFEEFNSDMTLEQIAYIVGEDNLIEEYNEIKYYNYDFKSQVNKFELTDHRIENDLHVDMIVYLEVKKKLENRLCFKENKIDYVIEESDENYDSDISISSLSSNDSETTKRRKKGKAVCKEH